MPKRKSPKNEQGITPGEVVARQVKAIRDRRGWTQAELADRLEAYSGWAVDRTLVAKVERGERALSVDDLFWFAWTLGVNPATLSLPSHHGEQLRVTPNTVTSGASPAWWWWRGHSPIGPLRPGEAMTEADRRLFYETVLPDWEAAGERVLPGAQEMARRAGNMLGIATGLDDPQRAAGVVAELDGLRDDVNELLRRAKRLAATATKGKRG